MNKQGNGNGNIGARLNQIGLALPDFLQTQLQKNNHAPGRHNHLGAMMKSLRQPTNSVLGSVILYTLECSLVCAIFSLFETDQRDVMIC